MNPAPPSGPDDLTATRTTLLARLRNWDDGEGWKLFFDTYWKLIYNAALKAGLQDADAQDLVQDTVIEVSERIAEFKHAGHKGSFKTWLLNLAKWRIADRLRAHRRSERMLQPPRRKSSSHPRTATEELVPDEAGADLAEVLENEWKTNLFEAAIERLKHKVDAKRFQMFDLHVLKQRPVADVAKALGVSAPSVYMAKYRMMRLIKKEVARLETSPI